ncbi:PAS domain S-box protein [Oceanobacillus halophilus]|uniref:PAS domain S-box protein n=1 Tax=Oceanobacillus halophilus TaxID=930130 RepID=A0A494ZVB7_9BACI|nr:PAS domain S-box protein [Oceanobacillus halophilus]RKQ30389.1 PAS domain S-box protein [Oceanobacillus halophilus]
MAGFNGELDNQHKFLQLEEYIKTQINHTFTIASAEKEPFFIINLENQIRYASDCCEPLLGYAPDELSTMNLYDIFPNSDLPITDFFTETLQTAAAKAFTKNYCESKELRLIFLPIYSNDHLIGRYVFFKSTMLDQPSLEAEPQEDGDTSYKNLIDHSPFGIIIVANYKVEYINLLALRAMGAKGKESVVGKSIFDLVPAEDIPLVREKIDQSDQSVIERPYNQRILKLDGSQIETEMQVLPAIYNQKKMTHFIIRDLFDHKKHFNLSILIATGIAYELKNPVIRVKGFMELIRSGKNEEAYFNQIAEDMSYIEKIVNEVLVLEGNKYGIHNDRDASTILGLIKESMK